MRNQQGFTPIGKVLDEALLGSFQSKLLFTGFPDLDLCLGGFSPGELIIVGGRSQACKTTFGLAVAQHAAFSKRRPVAFISLESQATELRQRMMSAESEVPLRAIRSANLSQRQIVKIQQARQRCTGAVLLLDDPARATVQELHGRLRRHRASIDLIVVDNIHLLDDGDYIAGYEEEMFTSVMRNLKILARSLDAVVLGISRLSREAEYQAGSPTVESLIGAEAVSQFADTVLLLDRSDRRTDSGDVVDVFVAQNKKGPTDAYSLAFLSDFVALRQIAA